MEINGYGTLGADYYAQLARRRAGANQAAESNPAAAEFAVQGMRPNSAPDEPQTTNPVPSSSPATDAASGTMAAGATSGQDLLNLLSNQPVGGSMGGSFENTDTARGSIFNEMLKSFGVAGDHARAQQYMQETIRRTYGVM